MFSDPDVEQLWHAGKIRAAYEASAKKIVPVPTTDHPFRDPVALLDAARQWHEHGTLCWYVARFAECGELLERAHAARVSSLGADHPDTLDTVERLAALAHYQLSADASTRFGEVIARLERVHGPGTTRVAIAQRNCAAALRDQRKLDEAGAMLGRARAVLEAALPPEHPEVIAALKVSALLLNIEKKHHEAIVDAERAVAMGSRAWSADHPMVAHAELSIAEAELRLGDHKRAAKRMPSIIARIERGLGHHPMLGLALVKHAECELAAGRNFMRAEELARRGGAVYMETYPAAAHPHWVLFHILYESRQIVEAGELVLELGERLPRRYVLAMTGKLANHLMRIRDYRAALPWVERSRDLCDDPAVAAAWSARVEQLRRQTD
jgi:tetratricopeptide (TPR) repeat protein